jgi:hypothetical protein
MYTNAMVYMQMLRPYIDDSLACDAAMIQWHRDVDLRDQDANRRGAAEAINTNATLGMAAPAAPLRR